MIQNMKKPKKVEQKAPKVVPTHHLSLVERIYEENKQRIACLLEEHPIFAFSSSNTNDGIAYSPNQKPLSETYIYINNKNTHNMRSCYIVAAIQERIEQCEERNRQLTIKYDKMDENWKKRVIKMETKREKREDMRRQRSNSNTNKSEDVTSKPQRGRPILRSNQPNKPVNYENNVNVTSPGVSRRGYVGGDSVRSEAELVKVISKLREEEIERDNRTRYIETVAKIPDMILPEEKYYRYINNNGLIEDPVALDRERKPVHPWSDEEKSIFVSKYMQYPKNFGEIASYLMNKTTRDVVHFYYLNKKSLQLKKLLRDQSRKRSGRGGARYNSREPPPSINIPPETPRSRNLRSGAPITPHTTLPLMDDDSSWTDAERETLIMGIGKHGKDFKAISILIGTRTSAECKTFYINNKKKLGLESVEEVSKTQNNGGIKKSTSDQQLNNNTAAEELKEKRVYWTANEKGKFLKCLKIHGKDWARISQEIPTKTQSQVKNYFQNYKNKLNLTQHLPPNSNNNDNYLEEEMTGKRRTRRFVQEENRKKERRILKIEDTDDSDDDNKINTDLNNTTNNIDTNVDISDDMVTEEGSNITQIIKLQEDNIHQTIIPVVEEVKGAEDLVNIANSLADLADLSSMISSDAAATITQPVITESTTQSTMIHSTITQCTMEGDNIVPEHTITQEVDKMKVEQQITPTDVVTSSVAEIKSTQILMTSQPTASSNVLSQEVTQTQNWTMQEPASMEISTLADLIVSTTDISHTSITSSALQEVVMDTSSSQDAVI